MAQEQELEVGVLVEVIATAEMSQIEEVTREGGRTEYVLDLGGEFVGFAAHELAVVR